MTPYSLLLIVVLLGGFAVCAQSDRLQTDTTDNESNVDHAPVQNELADHPPGSSSAQYHDYGNWTDLQNLSAFRVKRSGDICGITAFPPDRNRIVNGQVAHHGNFPWMAALVHKTYQHYCGATILDADWVLTAAHCMIGPWVSNNFRIDYRDMQRDTTVIIGVMDLTRATADNKYGIAEMALHPNYDPAGWVNDIILLRLSRSIPHFDDTQRPACLPIRSLKETVAATGRKECFFAGWGYVQQGPGIVVSRDNPEASTTPRTREPFIGAGKDSLLYGRLNYVPKETCQQTYRTWGAEQQVKVPTLQDSQVCASSSATLQVACLGDSGGGLYCKEPDASWTVYGIASWSAQCSNKVPSVFASVFSANKFILRILNRRTSSYNVYPGFTY